MEVLNHTIKAKTYKIGIEDVKNPNNTVIRADDEFYIQNKTSRGWGTAAIGVFFLLLSLIFLLPVEDGKHLYWVFSGVFGLGLFLILYAFIAPRKYLELNRMEGLITVPRFMWMKSVTFPFSEGVGIKKYYTRSLGVIASQLCINRKDNRWIGGRITDYYVEEFWSFIVWYMDKNRPLPPGSAFAPYKQKDFERRKAEGFPPPLYGTSFPTQEASRKQQKERERYWKDR